MNSLKRNEMFLKKENVISKQLYARYALIK